MLPSILNYSTNNCNHITVSRRNMRNMRNLSYMHLCSYSYPGQTIRGCPIDYSCPTLHTASPWAHAGWPVYTTSTVYENTIQSIDLTLHCSKHCTPLTYSSTFTLRALYLKHFKSMKHIPHYMLTIPCTEP